MNKKKHFLFRNVPKTFYVCQINILETFEVLETFSQNFNVFKNANLSDTKFFRKNACM